LQDIRPIRGRFGVISTENKLEIEAQFLYNKQRIEDDCLIWDYAFMETPHINVAIDELTFSLSKDPCIRSFSRFIRSVS